MKPNAPAPTPRPDLRLALVKQTVKNLTVKSSVRAGVGGGGSRT